MQYGQPFHLFGQRLLLPIPPVHHETENLLRRAWHRARGVPIRFCKDPSGELFHGFVGQGIVTEQMELPQVIRVIVFRLFSRPPPFLTDGVQPVPFRAGENPPDDGQRQKKHTSGNAEDPPEESHRHSRLLRTGAARRRRRAARSRRDVPRQGGIHPRRRALRPGRGGSIRGRRRGDLRGGTLSGRNRAASRLSEETGSRRRIEFDPAEPFKVAFDPGVCLGPGGDPTMVSRGFDPISADHAGRNPERPGHNRHGAGKIHAVAFPGFEEILDEIPSGRHIGRRERITEIGGQIGLERLCHFIRLHNAKGSVRRRLAHPFGQLGGQLGILAGDRLVLRVGVPRGPRGDVSQLAAFGLGGTAENPRAHRI